MKPINWSLTLLVAAVVSIIGAAAARSISPLNPEERLPAHLVKAVDHPNRPEADRDRDAGRKPAETLAFFGVKPGMRVVELMAGQGWYVEILARAVGEKGRVYAHNSPFVLERFAEGPLSARLEKPDLDNVVRINAPLDDPQLPDEVDAVLIFLFYHDAYWQKVNRPAMNRAVFEALKPGGVYGIVDHHAKPGSGAEAVQTLHRVDADLVKREILAAGFTLEAESDLLANPKDTRDYNVFRFREAGMERDRTDRFVYLFRKPKE